MIFPTTNKQKADIIKVLKTLAEVVEEAGADYVYVREADQVFCTYVKDGQPDCIAARVLVKLGVSADFLAAHEGDHCANLVGPDVPLGGPALGVLREAQRVQDGGRPTVDPTWGNALGSARQFAEVNYGVTE